MEAVKRRQDSRTWRLKLAQEGPLLFQKGKAACLATSTSPCVWGQDSFEKRKSHLEVRHPHLTSEHFREGGGIILPTVQMGKWEHRGVKVAADLAAGK